MEFPSSAKVAPISASTGSCALAVLRNTQLDSLDREPTLAMVGSRRVG
jgi:hypothetical protein